MSKSMMAMGRIESGVMVELLINSRLVEEDEMKCGACRGTGFRMDRLDFDCSLSMRCQEKVKACASHRCYSCEGEGVAEGVMTDSRILEQKRETYAMRFDSLRNGEGNSPYLRESAAWVAAELRAGRMDDILIDLKVTR